MMARQAAQLAKKILRRNDKSHVADDRFENDAGNLVAQGLEGELQRIDVVEPQQQRLRGTSLRHARAVGHAQRGGAGAGGHEETIDVAVVAASVLHYHVTVRVAAGQANGAHRRLGAGADHARHFERWHQLAAQFGQLAFRFGRRAEGGPFRHRRVHVLDDARVAVAEDERTPGADEIEMTVAVDAEAIRPLAALDDDGLTADRAERAGGAVDAAGNRLAGAGEGSGAFCTRGHVANSVDNCLPLPDGRGSEISAICSAAAPRRPTPKNVLQSHGYSACAPRPGLLRRISGPCRLAWSTASAW